MKHSIFKLFFAALVAMFGVCTFAQECLNDEIWYTSTDGEVIKPYSTYSIYAFGATIISNTYTNGKGVIKFSDNVTSIGDGAFYQCSSLTSITIPEGVTSIGKSAFSCCSSLTSITLLEGVTSIGDYAFSSCPSLTSITLPEGVTNIGDYVFDSCSNLTSITIPEGVTSIGNGVFSGCSSLISITLPEGVASIGNYSFHGCSSLTSITIPKGVTSIGEDAFSCCSKLTSITLPEGVTNIGNSAFFSCSSLTSITIPEGVTNIGKKEFWGCSTLSSITIPEGVTRIDEQAFYNCSSLSSITIPKSLTSFGDYVFHSCSKLSSIIVPQNVTNIGEGVFWNCYNLKKIYCLGTKPASFGGNNYDSRPDIYVPLGSKSEYENTSNWNNYTLREYCMVNQLVLELRDDSYLSVIDYWGKVGETQALTIPSTAQCYDTSYNITKIDDSVFKNNTGLTNIVMPNSIEEVGAWAFYGCSNLKSVTLSKNITTLPYAVFANCTALESISIPAATLTIGGSAFEGCKLLQTVTMKDHVTTIYGGAFRGCSSLRAISIPSNCNSVDATAFNGCTSLKAFSVADNNSNYATLDGVLTNKAKNKLIAYPSAKGSTYEIPATITSIGNSAFCGSELTSLHIPATVSEINNYAFADCSKLSDVVFESCANSISVNGSIFWNAPLSNVEIDRPINNFYSDGPDTPFYNNTSLKSVTIGDNVTWLYGSMFYGCTSLSNVSIGENVTSIGQSAFQGCNSLISINIPAKVTSIGDEFLNGCSGLKQIDAKMENPPVMQSSAFAGINKNTCKLVVPDNYEDTYNETPGWMSFNTITKESDVDWAIYYTSSDGKVVVPTDTEKFGTNILANTYDGRKGRILFDGKVTNIGDGAFSTTNLASIVIPKGVTNIDMNAFADCHALASIKVDTRNPIYDSHDNCNAIIKTATHTLVAGGNNTIIPDDVTSIGKYAFEGREALTSVHLPKGLKSIGSYAFSGCKGLKEIHANMTTLPTVEANVFEGVNKTACTLHIPYSLSKLYQGDANWKQFKTAYNPEDVTIGMSKGWNWISHDMAECIPLTAIASDMDYIVSLTQEAVKDPVIGWYGSITELDPTQTYKAKMNSAQEYTTRGQVFDCLNTDITIAPGWNWVGYPVCKNQSPDEALANFSASDGDVFVGQDGTSTYDATKGKWIGTLQNLETGKGYLLKSSRAATFRYDISAAAAQRAPQRRTTEETADCPWVADKHAYPNVMSMMACLKEGDGMLAADRYVVGAFCGEECRGVGRVVDGVIYITIYGQGDEMISFRLLDEQGEMLDATEVEPFRAEVLGSRHQPYALTISDAASMTVPDDSTGDVEYYTPDGLRIPSPRQGINIVRRRMSDGTISNQKIFVK